MHGHSLFEWSNWAYGLIAVLYVVVMEYRVHRESRRVRRISYATEPSSAGRESGEAGAADAIAPGVDPLVGDRVRSVLIQVGVDSLPFSLAVARLRHLGIDRQTVEQMARTLRESKLLRFTEPLEDSTKIRLS